MVCVREHINGLDCCYAVILAKNFKVTGLGCRIAADINHPFRGSIQDDLRDIRVDSGPWGIEYHHIRSSMLLHETVSKYIFHISCEKFTIAYSVCIGIYARIGNGFRHIFDSEYF